MEIQIEEREHSTGPHIREHDKVDDNVPLFKVPADVVFLCLCALYLAGLRVFFDLYGLGYHQLNVLVSRVRLTSAVIHDVVNHSVV